MSLRCMPPLSSLRAFEAVARRRSFKSAAEELAVTPSAISHQIRQLEAHVGIRLVDRTPRSVTLTEGGQTLRDATTSGFGLIAQAIRSLKPRDRSNMITITTTSALVSHWLAPRLSDLRDALPNLDVRFHASDAVEALAAGEIDVAVRYGQNASPELSYRRLFDDELIPVCSPALGGTSIDDLSRLTLLHIDGRLVPEQGSSWTRWCGAAGVTGVDTDRGPHLPDSMSAVQAAIAGQGVVIVSRLLVADALAAGLLVAPFGVSLPGDAYHFVAPHEIADTQDVAGLREWFVKQME